MHLCVIAKASQLKKKEKLVWVNAYIPRINTEILFQISNIIIDWQWLSFVYKNRIIYWFVQRNFKVTDSHKFLLSHFQSTFNLPNV